MIFPSMFLLFLFHQLSLNSIPAVAGTNILRPGDQLNSSQTLVSGNFTLGFFNISETNLYYIGIWYTNDWRDTKVWIANSDTPLVNNSGVLEIDIFSGTLRISLQRNTLKNISGYVGSSNTTVAKLEDSGNFKLLEEGNGRILWQSFDHPTNILLPHMKLGFNTTTRTNWTLTSWLSEYIPAPGAFTMSLEPKDGSGQLVVHRRGERYWTSGAMSKYGDFPNAPILTDYFLVGGNVYERKMNLVINNGGMYLYFTSDSPTPMVQLNSEGQIYYSEGQIYDSEGQIYDAEGGFYKDIKCYGYQSDDGCVSSTLPTCRKRGDVFKEKKADFFTGAYSVSSTYYDNSSLSFSDCMEACWEDCTCLGFLTNFENGTGCVTYNGNGKYVIDETGATISKYVLVSKETSSEVVHIRF